MQAREITSVEYGLLLGQLDDLPDDEAAGLRSLLAEKYYAYLDRLMQLKMTVREYDEVAEKIQAQTVPAGKMKV